ncbi:MAG TPA: ATP-binding protein [Candidatus Saccharimonadales bacterium]
MNITHILTLTISIASLASLSILASLLFIGARRTSRYFLAFIIVLLLWLFPQFLAQFIFYNDESIANIFLRISLLISGFVVPFLGLFIRELLRGKKVAALRMLSFILPILGVLTAFSPLTINSSINGIAVTSSAPFYYLLIYGVFLGFIISIFSIRRYERASKNNTNDKRAMYYLRQSLLLAVGLNIIGAAFFSNSEWSQVLTPLSMAVMTSIIYIAIFKHRLFDIRLIVTRTIAYLLLVSTLTALYAALVFALTVAIFSNSSQLVQKAIPLGAALLIAATAPYFKRLFDRVTNKIFYRDAYDPQELLDKFNKTLVNHIDMQPLLKRATSVIEEYLKSQFCWVGVVTTDRAKLRVIGTSESLFTENEAQLIREELSTIGQKVFTTESIGQTHEKVRSILRKHDIALVARLMTGTGSRQTAIAYLMLGPKKSGNTYSKQDLQIIEIVANELVIAIQNALRFQEIENFNATLQQRVEEATRKLRRANEKLKALDETKDDFISMASHQLRTPLTSVKGYLSMILDGDVGKVSPAQKEMIGQAFSSSQRMVYLIADLLNVSRLKTGKFVIEPKPVNLADLVEQELSQLDETAKTHSLDLQYDKPKDFLDLMLDETKIRQVVMNFVDNAIYYTPVGGKITVRLAETPTHVELRVEDNGIGVPKQEQPHLFTKFYRAGNARKARPDGTGLGLFMAKKVIIAQGGSLIFESQQDKGSTFGFVFGKHRLAVPTNTSSTAVKS